MWQREGDFSVCFSQLGLEVEEDRAVPWTHRWYCFLFVEAHVCMYICAPT